MLAKTDSRFIRLQDEIGVLYKEYNMMVEKNNQYIRESYQNKLVSLDSQMQAMEAQINSHFLFNTLESIYSIAEIEEVDSIAIMIKALGDMFRYTIKTKSELVPIDAEINHVKNYLRIQTIRYPKKINYEIDLSSDLKHIRVLKVILQPLVENAIQHGIIPCKKNCILSIKGYKLFEDCIFEIYDTGKGMQESKLNDIKNSLNSPSNFEEIGRRSLKSIGILNVHKRIQLYYGNNYGLKIDSSLEIGTRIIVKIPYRI